MSASKMAERLLNHSTAPVRHPARMPATSPALMVFVISSDAVSALVNLGYGRTEAFTAIAQAFQKLGDSADVEMLIKDGLTELSAFRPGDPQ